ncbi:MAG: histidine phosphatase family protein [Pseudomonadota bacterium]
MTKLIMVRHGETEWNLAGKMQGYLDSPLTETGLAQAKAAAKRLRFEQLDAIYSSDLGRARKTAKCIAKAREQVVQTHEGLREKSLGVLQGLTRSEMEQRHPESFQAWKQSDYYWTPPEGESQASFTERCMITLEDLHRRHTNQTLALVTHGGFIAAVFRKILNLDWKDSRRRFSVLNASLNTFVYKDDNWQLETWGDISHLGYLNTLDDESIGGIQK